MTDHTADSLNRKGYFNEPTKKHRFIGAFLA
jgi:hypothetical protein